MIPVEDNENEINVITTSNNATWTYVLWSIVAFVWVVAGIASFFVSIMCFGLSGSMTQKIFGFILAIVFGPIYLLYWWVSKDYCRGSIKKSKK